MGKTFSSFATRQTTIRERVINQEKLKFALLQFKYTGFPADSFDNVLEPIAAAPGGPSFFPTRNPHTRLSDHLRLFQQENARFRPNTDTVATNLMTLATPSWEQKHGYHFKVLKKHRKGIENTVLPSLWKELLPLEQKISFVHYKKTSLLSLPLQALFSDKNERTSKNICFISVSCFKLWANWKRNFFNV